jgi:hypothetical protein
MQSPASDGCLPRVSVAEGSGAFAAAVLRWRAEQAHGRTPAKPNRQKITEFCNTIHPKADMGPAWLACPLRARTRHHAVAVRANMRSILVAMMKSFSCSPLIFLVCRETVTLPQPKLIFG